MKLAFTTTFDAMDVHNWSGTPYHMAHAFSEMHDVELIGSLKRQLPFSFKLKQIYKKYVSAQRESPRFNIFAAQAYSQQVQSQLRNLNVDAIISPRINPIAYLETNKPIILWTDAVYAALLGFYEPFSTHSYTTIQQGNAMTAECLRRSRLAIFSSDWAANSAIELYGAAKEKIKVVPFGANLTEAPDYTSVKEFITQRSTETIKLLFLAKSWERKGGNIVLNVAKALHDAGHTVELTIVGYCPKELLPLPSYVNYLGFISKHSEAGKLQLQKILANSHFLFVPSRAEAYGIVFCEANAYGVPCLTSHVGGISTIVKDNVNGKTFALDADVKLYCEYIVNTLAQRSHYEALALSAQNEYQTRLNWQVATKKVTAMIKYVSPT